MYKVIIVVIVVLVTFSVGVFVIKSQKAKLDLDTLEEEKTFYATIESMKESNSGSVIVFVKGLEVNDMNYRGKFTFSIKDDIAITCRGENINASNLNVGDTIIITFNDEIIVDISPTPLEKVTKIEIVDDEWKENL